MRPQRTIAKQNEECAWCAYPFDAGDDAIMIKGNDTSIYCSVNCATKSSTSRSLTKMFDTMEGEGSD